MTGIIIRDTPREKDDQVLAMLALRKAGYSWSVVAKAANSKPQAAHKTCADVLRHDLKYSGEPEARVRAGYR
jgi:hypothetical protein